MIRKRLGGKKLLGSMAKSIWEESFPTPYSDANRMIEILQAYILSILGRKLAGLYLEGSLVIGDFDPKTSDIDLLAALTREIDDREFEALKQMHAEIVEIYPEWDDRIEVCYISLEALSTVKSRQSWIVNISPGEPIHRLETKKEWVMNWYLTREKSKTLFGPDPKTVIEPITKEEFILSVQDHARAWEGWVAGMKNRYAQSYAILSMCRALYSYRNGDQVSKRKAAEWAQGQLPEWAGVIQKGLDWKETGKDPQLDEASYPETVRFVRYVRSMILIVLLSL